MRHLSTPWVVLAAVSLLFSCFEITVAPPPIGDELFQTIGTAIALLILGFAASFFHSSRVVGALFYAAMFLATQLSMWFKVARTNNYSVFAPQFFVTLGLGVVFFVLLLALGHFGRGIQWLIRKLMKAT